MRDFTFLIAESEGRLAVEWYAPLVWTGIIFALILAFGIFAVRGETRRAPASLLTKLAEHAYLFIENMCIGVIGPHGRKYVTLVLTNWIVIFVSNLFGVLGLFAPTSTLGITFGMAVLTVMYVQFEGIKANGPLGYVKHFFGPPLGLGLLPVTLLLFVIEIISELAKMISLSFRLYGNISGERKVGETLGSLIKVSDNFSVPLEAALLPLGVFVSLVQALVFTLLTCVYLSLMTHHKTEHAEAQHAHA